MSQLCIQIDTVYTCATTIATFFYLVTVLIFTDIFQHEYMAQICVETFQQNVCLPVSEVCTPIYRTAVTIRALFTQIVSQLNLNALTAYSGHVQVFIISLWCTETGRIRQTSLKIFSRLIEEIDARTEN